MVRSAGSIEPGQFPGQGNRDRGDRGDQQDNAVYPEQQNYRGDQDRAKGETEISPDGVKAHPGGPPMAGDVVCPARAFRVVGTDAEPRDTDRYEGELIRVDEAHRGNADPAGDDAGRQQPGKGSLDRIISQRADGNGFRGIEVLILQHPNWPRLTGGVGSPGPCPKFASLHPHPPTMWSGLTSAQVPDALGSFVDLVTGEGDRHPLAAREETGLIGVVP